MATLMIDESLADRLRQIALRENRPLDDVLRSMVEFYHRRHEPSDWPLVMAKMADADTDIEWNELAPDLAERSREILQSEFGDYLEPLS
jgi:hypothetical protein